MSLPEHLGGHGNITHIDKAALKYMIDAVGVSKMIDVGCGPGGMIKVASEEFRLDAYGVDGDNSIRRDIKNIYIHDFTTGVFPYKRVDLAWSVEFLEHVEERYIPNYMATMRCARYVLCTAAPPSRPGHHHVNCKPFEYWVQIFKKYGFNINVDLTNKVRKISSMHRSFIRENGMVFERIDNNRKLNVGCGTKWIDGYEHNDMIDSTFIDWKCRAIDIVVPNNVFTGIYARHWLEHLTYEEAKNTIQFLITKISHGGYIHIIVPNIIYHAAQLTIPGNSKFISTSNFEHAMAGFYGWNTNKNPYLRHLWGYTQETLRALLSTYCTKVDNIDTRECDIEMKGFRL